MSISVRILWGLPLFFTVGLSGPALGQDDSYRYAHLSAVEGEVSLQRASEPEPESGALNVPVFPGDRIWTLSDSRAEVQFADGSTIRLSEGAKIDFVDLDSETILRLWSGSIILNLVEPRDGLRIDSAAGSVRPAREGTYRVDLDEGDVLTLSVWRGSAELATAQGTVLVQSGETSTTEPGERPGIPASFNTASLDDFSRWSEERDRAASTTNEVIVRSLPHEVRPYADDLGRHGEWYRDPDYGYVWYPQVGLGWAPYTYGNWWHSRFGYTWIPHEPWGWAPFHYGRWGFKPRGWYWIPGPVWSPAWVSFAIGPTWVGWSPLGFHDRPIVVFNQFFGRHRRRFHGDFWGHRGGGWNFCSRDDFRSGLVTRGGYRRLDPDEIRTSSDVARIVNEPSALDRELNPRVFRVAERRSELDRPEGRGVVVRDGLARSGSRPERRGVVTREGFADSPAAERANRRDETRSPRESVIDRPREAAPRVIERRLDRGGSSSRGEEPLVRRARPERIDRPVQESSRERAPSMAEPSRQERTEAPRSRRPIMERSGGRVRDRETLSAPPLERTARPSGGNREGSSGRSLRSFESERSGGSREPSSMRGGERGTRSAVPGSSREMSRGGGAPSGGRSLDRAAPSGRDGGHAAGAGGARSRGSSGARSRPNRTP